MGWKKNKKCIDRWSVVWYYNSENRTWLVVRAK